MEHPMNRPQTNGFCHHVPLIQLGVLPKSGPPWAFYRRCPVQAQTNGANSRRCRGFWRPLESNRCSGVWDCALAIVVQTFQNCASRTMSVSCKCKTPKIPKKEFQCIRGFLPWYGFTLNDPHTACSFTI